MAFQNSKMDSLNKNIKTFNLQKNQINWSLMRQKGKS